MKLKEIGPRGEVSVPGLIPPATPLDPPMHRSSFCEKLITILASNAKKFFYRLSDTGEDGMKYLIFNCDEIFNTENSQWLY